MRKIIAVACLSILAGCGVDPVKAKRILEGQGMTDVVIGGYPFWGCSDKDTFKSSFTAKDSRGHDVSGVVCGGVLKGYTVRFD
jgi:hypothetical protein